MNVKKIYPSDSRRARMTLPGGVLNKLKKAKDKKFVFGFSGGVDSRVLFELLLHSKTDFIVVHVDHSLRKKSEEDAEFVVSICKENEVKCYIIKADVPAFMKKWKMGAEEAGRKIRRSVFMEILQKEKADEIILAHHLNDKIETILLNLMRGASEYGMIGIREKSGKFWRPMIGVSRDQILQYAEKNKLKWVEDESNQSLKYKRNKVRHVLIPSLKKNYPDFEKKLLKLSVNAEKESGKREKFAKKFLKKNQQIKRDDFLKLTLKQRGDVLREVWKKVHGSVMGFETERVREVNRLVKRNIGKKKVKFGEVWLSLDKGKLRLTKTF